MLVEHGVALREALLALGGTDATDEERHLRARFLEHLARLLYRDADRTVSVCDFNTGWERRLGLTPDRVRVVPNGIDPSRYPDLSARVGAVPTVGWIGRIDPFKGLETLITAFRPVVRRLPHARLRLFGPTPRSNEVYLRALVRHVRAAGLTRHVTFEGQPASVQAALEVCDVVALPSVSEGLPYAALEAMMSGRAVVANDVGGVGEALGTAGRLIPPHDPEAFGHALLDLLLDPVTRTELGRAARARALEHFTSDLMLERYLAVFDELLTRRTT